MASLTEYIKATWTAKCTKCNRHLGTYSFQQKEEAEGAVLEHLTTYCDKVPVFQEEGAQ